jgi:hypothetical protein
MQAHFDRQKELSRASVISSRHLLARPAGDARGLIVTAPIQMQGEGGSTDQYAPTHWAFGQLAALAGAPAGYLRTLPSEMAADCINYGMQFKRDIEDVGVLLYNNGAPTLRAATGGGYGRIWNATVTRNLRERFGNGVNETGWTVPGMFGKPLDQVTKANTTLYAGDRDMFVFLADERNRIEIPNRRDGKSGSLARGFFVWNSEVGSAVFGIASFLFDYVCCNRMVWGATQFKELRIRHTAGAPDRFLEQVQPALTDYANSSARMVTDIVEAAQRAKLDQGEKLDAFLKVRFGKHLVEPIKKAHVEEEGRPIETMWDAATAATAYARSITWQDERVAIERKAGDLLDLATK